MFINITRRHNERDGVSNHQHQDCLLNRLFRRRSKKTSKLCVTGLCAGNSPVTGEFPAQKASSAENVSIWWSHHQYIWHPCSTSTVHTQNPVVHTRTEVGDSLSHAAPYTKHTHTYTLAANVMESLLLIGICVNLIGIYCFWSYVQLRNEILLISSIHYGTKLNVSQYCLPNAETQEKEKSEFRGSHLKWSLPRHYHFDALMQRGVSVNTIDISLNF